MADHIRGNFLWHELMTSNVAAAEAFYTKVVGWKTQTWQDNPTYKLWMAAGKGMGGLMAIPEEAGKSSPPPQWFCYIGTNDVDETVRKAVELGGRVMKSAMDIPTVGRVAFLTDPQGAPFGAFTPKPAPAPPEGATELGDWSWHELLTSDWQAAWNFYHKLFGWEKMDAMDMGGGNMYQMYGLRGRMLGGMMSTAPGNHQPPAWLSYVLVRDAKRAADVIANAGGKVINGPMEVPGGDWITAGIDPQGAMFAVHSKKAAPKNENTKGTKKATKTPKKSKSSRAATKKTKTTKKSAAKKTTGGRKKK